MSDSMRKVVEQAMDKLAASMPEPKNDPELLPTHHIPRTLSLSPKRKADELRPEHRALIGQWATVDLSDGAGVARLPIHKVSLRRDGRVRAEMWYDGLTVYREIHELRDVGVE